MTRSSAVLVCALIGALATATAAGAAQAPRERLDVYAGVLPSDRLQQIVALGVDRHELEVTAARGQRGEKAKVRVEAILSREQAAQLRDAGIDMKQKQVGGQSVAERATALAQQGHEVFRPYAERAA